MSEFSKSKINRRGVLKSSMAVLGGGLLSRYSLEKAAAEQEPAVKNVNLNSSPSTLKITDMRYAIIVKPGPSPCPIIRIDTNQGVYGLGEVRDGAGYQYAMVLKNRLVGENPLKIDFLFQKVQQFGGISRQGGGVCAMARDTSSRHRCGTTGSLTTIDSSANLHEGNKREPSPTGLRNMG
jgi:hypothetical protein